MNMPQTFPDIAAENTRAALRATWDRGDGYDANDPSAPDVWRCGGCDTMRPTEVCYCPECGGLTASYLDRQSDEPVLWLGSAWPATEAV